jgi:hypothetical protein
MSKKSGEGGGADDNSVCGAIDTHLPPINQKLILTLRAVYSSST